MAKYVFNASVFEGDPLRPASLLTEVTVTNEDSGTTATLWEDEDGLILKDNPFTLDVPGEIVFYANEIKARIRAVNGIDELADWRNVLIGPTGSGAGGAAAWGDISGTLSNQTDLQAALDAKEDSPTGVLLTGNRTLALADNGEYFYVPEGATTNAIIEIPDGFPDGYHVTVANGGTGEVRFTMVGSEDIQEPKGGTLTLETQGGYASIIRLGGNYFMFGLVEVAV